MHTDKIRIALIVKNEQYAGGSSSYEAGIIKYLQLTATESIEFVIFQPSGYGSREISWNICEYRNGFISEVTSFLRSTIFGRVTAKICNVFMGSLEKSFLNQSIDIAYFLSPNPLSLGLINIPMINTVWDLGHRDLPGYKEMASRIRFAKRELYYSRVLPKSLLVVTDSKTTSHRIEKLYGVQRNKIMDAGLFPTMQNKSNKYQLQPIPNGEEYLIYPAQFWRHKNHTLLVDLMVDAKKSFPNLKLYLTGSDKGEMLRIRELIALSNLEDSIRILGFVDSEILTSLIKGAKALVYPSRLGPTNLPPLEALMLGTPVVVTKTNSNLIHDPSHGVWVVEDDSLIQFSEAVYGILLDSIRIEPMSFEEANSDAAMAIVSMIKRCFIDVRE